MVSQKVVAVIDCLIAKRRGEVNEPDSDMDFTELQQHKNIYFIGIGGISMSGLAMFLLYDCFNVSGSDATKTDITIDMEKKGIKINYTQVADNIDANVDLVVYSAAIHDDNEEMIKAKSIHIKCIKRSELLGCIMSRYKYRINIAGMHGKSTTTSMISKIVDDANLKPTISIGAVSKDIDSHYKIGNKEYFVAEACEYTNSFFDFCPNIEVITNIEEEHLDFFKDINDIRNSFKIFIDKMDETGILVINANIDNIKELTRDYKGKVYTYGFENADFYPKNLKHEGIKYIYELWYKDKFISNIELNLIGIQNVENSIAAVALGYLLGIDTELIYKSLSSFKGTKRRLENRGVYGGITVIDDYAHHPQEIKASLLALKELNANKMYLIYQPHTYSRTKLLYDDFIDVFKEQENLIFVPIYAAREKNIYNIESVDIANELNNKYNINAIYLDSFEKAVEYIKNNIKTGDLVVTMGAGDVYKITDQICTVLKK